MDVYSEATHLDLASDLESLFNPRSIALIGASERSVWSHSAIDNLRRFGFNGKIHLVNPRGGTIFDQAAATSCSAVGEKIDAALLMVPEAAILETIEDLRIAGARGAVLLTAGLAELGEEGAVRQRQIAKAAREAGIRLLGPNCLGFVNFSQNVALWTNQARRPMRERSVAVVSQSGATAGQLGNFAYQQRVGLTHIISTGNEADVDIVDAIDYLVDQDEVRSIALFLESVRRPDAFLSALRKARTAGKPIVALKVGASEAAAKAAQSHTGSLVGDDKVFSAVCRQYGVPRVRSMEELITVADLLAKVGPVDAAGFALVGMSGGMCEIATDHADAEGVCLTELTGDTIAKLEAVMPDIGTSNNPLDLTGAAMLKTEIISNGIAAIASDPGVGIVVYIFDSPSAEGAEKFALPYLEAVSKGFEQGNKPGLMLSHTFTPVTGAAKDYADKYGISYSGAGLTLGVTAIGHLLSWSASLRRTAPSGTRKKSHLIARPVGERKVLDYLASAGVPTIPGSVAGSAADAEVEAATFDGPAVLKVASVDIAHKTEVGGVALNVNGGAEVKAAFDRIIRNARKAEPQAQIDGVIVSPMRPKGTELFVGTMKDPQWGPVIAVGLGGVFVEALKDTSLRVLPVEKADVLEMLEALRGKALLNGFRGTPPVDRDVVAEVVVAIGNAALGLGENLVSLEVNPLLVSEAGVEALDGLAIWED